MPSITRFAEQLEPGDILLTSPKPSKTLNPATYLLDKTFTLASQAIQGTHTHALMYVGDGHVVETRMGGVAQHLPLKKALKTIDRVKALRPKLPRTERQAAAEKAKEIVKNKPAYAIKSLLKALLHNDIVKPDLGKVDGYMCSNLISKAYDRRLVDKPKHAVLPVDFARSKRIDHIAEHIRRDG